MNGPNEIEWRYDRVEPSHEWAACVWEYGRRWHHTPGRCGRLKARMATVGALCEMVEFPNTPWLGLPQGFREECSRRWRYAPGELEDCEPLVRAVAKVFGPTPTNAEEWRVYLRKEGVVVFDLGLPPRDARPKWQDGEIGVERQPTRAELLARFEAWLDANPSWWHGQGDGRVVSRIGGKESPHEGLRALAWAKIRETAVSDKAACDYLDKAFMRSSILKQWFAISLEPRATTVRSRLRRASTKWQKRVCEPD